jgi:hypothetical protein
MKKLHIKMLMKLMPGILGKKFLPRTNTPAYVGKVPMMTEKNMKPGSGKRP